MWALLLKKFKQPSITIPPQRHMVAVNPIGQLKYPDWDISRTAERYKSNDDVYSLVRRLSSTSAQVPSYPMAKRKDPAVKKYFKELKNFKPTGKPHWQKLLITKALEELPEDNRLAKLLDNPSLTLGKYEFYEALYAMLYLHGEVIVYKERGGIRNEPIQFHLLYPQHVQLLVTQTYPQKITGYQYSVYGQVVMENIPKEDVIHIRYFNPSFSAFGDELRGLSPIKVLHTRLNRMDSNMNVSTSQLRNGGIPGILYDDSGLDGDTAKEVIDARKTNFYKYLNAPENKGAPYFTHGKQGYIPIGSSNVDMDVTALENVDFKKLCNAYGLSSRLFNHDGTGSEISDDNAQRGLYTNGCLPNVFRVNEAFELSLNLDFKDETYVIQADLSEIPELQEDTVKLAQGFANLPIMIPNNILEAFKYGRSEDPLMDKVYVKQGYMLLEDMIIPDPIEPPDDNAQIP